jgi:hypothetical protein
MDKQDYFDELMEGGGDWLRRNFHEYTHSTSTNSFDLFKNGKPYSRGLVKLDNEMSASQRALQINGAVRRVVNTISNLDPRKTKDVQVTYSGKDSSASADKKRVTINVEAFGPEHSEYIGDDANKALDVTLGFAVHEMLHILRTDIGPKAPKNGYQGTSGQQRQAKAIHRLFWNTIEDERIEKWGGDNIPGYMPYVAAAKKFTMGLNNPEVQKFKHSMIAMTDPALAEVMEFTQLVFDFIRYPGNLTREVVNKYEKELRELQAAMTPFPETEEQVNEITNKVYEMIENKIVQLTEPPPQQGGGEGDESDDQKDGEQGEQGKGGGKSQKDDKKGQSGSEKQDSKGQSGGKDDSKKDDQQDENSKSGGGGAGADKKDKEQKDDQQESGDGKQDNQQKSDGEDGEDEKDSQQESGGQDGAGEDEKEEEPGEETENGDSQDGEGKEEGDKSEEDKDGEDEEGDGEESGKDENKQDTEDDSESDADDSSGDGGGGEGEEELSEQTLQDRQDKIREMLSEMLDKMAGQDLSEVNESQDRNSSAAKLRMTPSRLAGAEAESSEVEKAQVPPEDLVTHAHEFPQTEHLKSNHIPIEWLDRSKVQSDATYAGRVARMNYKAALEDVQQFSAGLRRRLQRLNRNHRQELTGMFDGELDDTRLADTRTRSSFKNYYKEEREVKNPGVTIVLLEDESGSMSGKKSEIARRIGVMFERATEGVKGVDLYVYGHTTGEQRADDDTTRIFKYYEGRDRGNRECLGQIGAHNTNRDGHAILEVGLRVRRLVNKPKEKIILIVVSDGQPSASTPGGYDGVSYTKACVNYLEKYQNTEVIQVAIEGGIQSAKMFNKFVTFTNFATLVGDLGGLLEKIIKQANTVK